MNSTNQITLPYDLDGIKLTIIAEIEPGEPMSYCSPGYGDSIDSVKIVGSKKVMGKEVEYELPEYMVDEMREKWGIDDLIIDEIEGTKKHHIFNRRAI